MKRKILTSLMFGFVGVFLMLIPQGESQTTAQSWPVSSPEAQGIDPAKLSETEQFINENLPDIHSLLIIKNGHLVWEKYYQTGAFDRPNEVYSVTKSVISILVGIALEKNYLQSLDQTIYEFLPEYFTPEVNPDLKNITLRHLLTMSSGLEWKEDYATPDTVASQWMASDDWVKFAFNLNPIHPPGTVFEYTSPNAHLLSVILTKATGMSTLDFAKQHLFIPLDISVTRWNQDPQGFHTGAFGLYLSPKDLTRLGSLCLHQGSWEGEPIISGEWLKAATQSQISTPWGLDYGYLWWIKPVNSCASYLAWGVGGQFIVVIPQHNTIIVTTSKTEFPVTPGTEYLPLFDLIGTAIGSQCS